MLQASDVSFAVGGRKIVDCVNLALVPGRVVVLIGPNGAGKSVLLRMLSGELKPTSGKILLDARNIGTLRAEELGARRAVLPQSSLLTFAFTALEVAMLGATVPGFGKESEATRQIALHTLESLGMAAARDQNYLHLSGGERQRVHIARALCQLATAPVAKPLTRYLLLDEPTSSLDLAHQSLLLEIIRGQAQQGCAVLAVLHDLNLASTLADSLLLLSGGVLLAEGPVAAVLRDDLLTAAYGCPVHVNRTPTDGRPFVLPPASLSKTA
jgi:iron complex transport system ATP-binding protein